MFQQQGHSSFTALQGKLFHCLTAATGKIIIIFPLPIFNLYIHTYIYKTTVYIPYALFISLKEVNAREGDEITALKYLLNVSIPPLSAP